MTEIIECIDDHRGECSGPVELRPSLTGTGTPIPRCDLHWEWTEKVDGTNIRIALTESGPVFGGRTEEAQIHASLLPVLNEIGVRGSGIGLEGLILMGEGYGPKIQSGGDYRRDLGFILFDVFTDHDNPLQRSDVENIASQLDIPVVPIVGSGTLYEAIAMVRDGFLSEVAEGRRRAEGLVMRPVIELRDRQGHRVITKVKTRDFHAGKTEGSER